MGVLTEELNFYFISFLIYLNLNSHMRLVATIYWTVQTTRV